jgi:tetratricopeptide (TPR) repeat protein
LIALRYRIQTKEVIMDKRFLLDKLKEAKETRNRELFLEVMQATHSVELGEPDLTIEFTDIMLELLDEWGWLDHMIEYTSNLVRQDPSDSQRKAELGCYYYKKGEFDKAEVIFASSLELLDNPMAQHYLDKIRKERSQSRRGD